MGAKIYLYIKKTKIKKQHTRQKIFYVENLHIMCEDKKKPRDQRPQIYNPQYENAMHRFT